MNNPQDRRTWATATAVAATAYRRGCGGFGAGLALGALGAGLGYGYPYYAYDDYAYGDCYVPQRYWWGGRWHWRRVYAC